MSDTPDTCPLCGTDITKGHHSHLHGCLPGEPSGAGQDELAAKSSAASQPSAALERLEKAAHDVAMMLKGGRECQMCGAFLILDEPHEHNCKYIELCAALVAIREEKERQ